MQAANWFIGLVVPEQAGWIAVASGIPPGVRRFHPLDLHLTVAFLGPCGAERAQAAWQALVQERHPSITAEAGSWLALGSPRRPSAFGLGLGRGHSNTAALMAHWGPAALAAANRPAEQRAPLPHITLARPTRRGGDAARAAMEGWIAQAPTPTTPAQLEHLALFTWAADRTERLFQVVAQRRLDGEPEPQLEAEV